MAEKAPPSLTAVAVSSLILGLLAGYFIGQGSSIGVFGGSGGSGGSKQVKKSWPNSYDVKVHADSSDDQADDEEEADEDQEDGDGKELKDFKDSNEDVKLVLAVRTDLGMGKGEADFITQWRLLANPSLQAKLQLNVLTRRLPATNTYSTTSPQLPCSNVGNGEDNPKSQCKSSLRRNWRLCKPRP
jgi:hypothetical protein